ncbi:MAG: asparagine synthase (glutamine-hydrolyzing) [Phycisphaerae bacterium]|nr:asparagine synthase (glutamine-hydrolyzing) [Phycisphaerae bacterium]
MCGIVTIAAVRGSTPSVDESVVVAMRDTMTARGPDDAGLWSDGQVHIGHRRLAVMAPNENAQPLVLDASGGLERVVLAFNGELYDLPQLRAALRNAGRSTVGRPLATCTDTELLAHAIAVWGREAVHHIRGMFAFVAWCPQREELIVARDALGVVPLFYAIINREIVIASEARAILAHPAMSVRPDWPTFANYLNSLRTTMGSRTLFEGVNAVGPGEVMTCSLSGAAPVVHTTRWWRAPREDLTMDAEAASVALRTLLEQTIDTHLVSDVPVCTLLSGGLDSTIIAWRARRSHPTLMSFCVGASEGVDETGDLAVARRIASALGTRHVEAELTQSMFIERWQRMVGELGMPLSTPNEVAIYTVADVIRPHAKVTLSGEGADELFAGYGPVLDQCAAWISGQKSHRGQSVESWHASTFAWVAPALLGTVLTPEVAERCDHGAAGVEALRAEFALAGDPMHIRTHLDVQRRLNLASLLQRLNTATMLASVEGRTPFADVRVAEFAARIPMDLLYAPAETEHGGGVGLATLPRTKRMLRHAFADCIPEEALTRPKASFPLPFERWVGQVADVLDTSPSAREVFSAEARAFVRAQPAQQWRLAWPMLNAALWLRRWFD